MSLSFQLNFNGDCQEAFTFYAQHLNGNVGLLLSFEHSPASASVPDYWQSKIVHANIDIGGVEIAGADVMPDQYVKPCGFYVLLSVESEKDVNNAFDTLSVGGETILPPQKTFWSKRYCIVIDRFGVPWKINCMAQ
ncbi:VOC family protein [Teredinibacter purpureus]|uniref:VOC family protein n=1 Tax=Teredinibacter purpureus TaxID=2731756 RepID=UPI0005F84381|nr:glyoxalase/bleomycin resistance/extradiol dioxygenase family protein [Teredinibacter purpureus]